PNFGRLNGLGVTRHMMRTLRENTKVIMLITALAFVGLMVFEWGMDLSGMSSAEARGGEIGRINGESISYEEYNAIQRRLYEQYQASRPGEPVTSAVDREIEKAAWNELVLDRLIRQEIRRRGLEASEAEVRRAARFMPPPELFASELFQTDGQFDLAKYQQFLASPAADDGFLLQLEAYYRDIIPREKLYAQVVSGSYIPDSELWRRWRDQYETARVRYIALDPAVIVPEGAVTVTDDEIADFYRRHRNDFQRPAQAVVRYTVLEKTPTAADTAAARDRALQLRQEILAGADFAEVAQRESADRMSAAMGGDLGTFGRGQMVPAFEEAVWSLPIDRVSEPVLTPFGYHLIQVRRRTGDEAEARHILIPIELTETTADALCARADSLEMLGLTRSVEEAARELGLEARTAELNPDLPFIAGIGAVDDGAEWAFEDAEPGEVSPVFETQSAFYMLELIQSTPAGVLSLEEATPGIRARMLVNRRLERA